MRREIQTWWSPSLNKNMEIVCYGSFGPALLLLPTAAADFLEYERFFMIDQVRGLIDAGKLKVYSINSINSESWLNNRMRPEARAIRHQQFNNYVENEVVPFIWNDCQGRVPIVTSGASFGALHGANMLFRRPDLFAGTIAMSGIYDLKYYAGGYYDDNVYFNSPVDYLPNLNEGEHLNALRHKRHIYIVTGKGPYEMPSATGKISDILRSKGIPHTADYWGEEWRHDWPTWRAMLPIYAARLSS